MLVSSPEACFQTLHIIVSNFVFLCWLLSLFIYVQTISKVFCFEINDCFPKEFLELDLKTSVTSWKCAQCISFQFQEALSNFEWLPQSSITFTPLLAFSIVDHPSPHFSSLSLYSLPVSIWCCTFPTVSYLPLWTYSLSFPVSFFMNIYHKFYCMRHTSNMLNV